MALQAFLTGTDSVLQRPPFGATLIPSGRPRLERGYHPVPRAPCVPKFRPCKHRYKTSDIRTESYTSIHGTWAAPRRVTSIPSAPYKSSPQSYRIDFRKRPSSNYWPDPNPTDPVAAPLILRKRLEVPPTGSEMWPRPRRRRRAARKATGFQRKFKLMRQHRSVDGFF